jgi:hypothetical protein
MVILSSASNSFLLIKASLHNTEYAMARILIGAIDLLIYVGGEDVDIKIRHQHHGSAWHDAEEKQPPTGQKKQSMDYGKH